MIRYRVLQLLFLASSMMSQVIGMLPAEEKKGIVEGIAEKIEELPKELQYKIFSSALALRENPKYEVYKKIDVGSDVTGIALNENNKLALTGSFDGVARLWDFESGDLLKELKAYKGQEPISSVAVALSADGALALTGSWDKTARVWNTNTGELIQTLEVDSRVNSVALSADGTSALTGSDDKIARLYNTSTGELLKELKGHKDIVSSVALSADGTLALTGSWDKTARVWNVLTGKLLTTLQVDLRVNSVALSADGTIALIKTRKKVLVWDAKSGVLLNRLVTEGYVHSVALSKDGKRALTGTDDGKIQVWNTKPLPGQKETSTPLTELAGHINWVTAVAFSGADFIASGSSDQTALILKPFALEPRAPLEHEEILRQAYKETFSRPLLRSTNGN